MRLGLGDAVALMIGGVFVLAFKLQGWSGALSVLGVCVVYASLYVWAHLERP